MATEGGGFRFRVRERKMEGMQPLVQAFLGGIRIILRRPMNLGPMVVSVFLSPWPLYRRRCASLKV